MLVSLCGSRCRVTGLSQVLRLLVLLAGSLTGFAGAAAADPVAQSFAADGLPGRLVICGGGTIPDAARTAFQLAAQQAAGEQSPGLVVIGTAAADPQRAAADLVDEWQQAGFTADAIQTASTDPETLASQLNSAVAVWFGGGQQSRLAEAYVGTVVETAIRRLLDRGGVIGGTSAGAAILSRVMIHGGTTEPELSTGLPILPAAIIDQHFRNRNRQTRLQTAVALHPDHFGLGIDEDTAVLVEGRLLQAVGDGQVTIALAATEYRPAAEFTLRENHVADLVQLQRAAADRAQGIDPGQPCLGPPLVSAGALVIVGGGGMPDEIVDRFITLAGGPDARIVVLPTASPRAEAQRQRIPGFLAEADVQDVRMLPHSGPDEVASEDFQTALKQATGIWFNGGRQWRFIDAYQGTSAVELFRQVLERGGVIGGSSAGATIQGEYLVRGHPLGNTVMMAEGYERGFGFLPGVTIDQHFSQRNRLSDLLPVITEHPQLLGIGIDESTAVVVQGDQLEIIGENSAFFLRSDWLPDPEAATGAPAADPVSAYRQLASGQKVLLSELLSGPRETDTPASVVAPPPEN